MFEKQLQCAGSEKRLIIIIILLLEKQSIFRHLKKVFFFFFLHDNEVGPYGPKVFIKTTEQGELLIPMIMNY